MDCTEKCPVVTSAQRQRCCGVHKRKPDREGEGVHWHRKWTVYRGVAVRCGTLKEDRGEREGRTKREREGGGGTVVVVFYAQPTGTVTSRRERKGGGDGQTDSEKQRDRQTDRDKERNIK